MKKHARLIGVIGLILIVFLTGALGYGYTLLREVRDQNMTLRNELETTRRTLAEKEAELSEYSSTLDEVRQAFAISEENGSELLKQLVEERGRNEEFEEQLQDITGTVGKLEKLSRLDPELLQKYSKVYFLNEHYAPEKLAEIPKEFTFKTDEPEYIHAQVAPKLIDLLEEAKEDGIDLLVVSAYRSYDEQKGLKSAYTVTYGSGANAFSADQGYSEHQLGTTVDLTTSGVGGSLAGFENTEAYEWLLKNAHRFGFILSYPEGNAYYIFEPWHWRFVGEKLADDLHDEDLSFYGADQRTIDSYLLYIFN